MPVCTPRCTIRSANPTCGFPMNRFGTFVLDTSYMGNYGLHRPGLTMAIGRERIVLGGSGYMRRIALKILPIALLLSAAVYGQSLGDVARENREKQKAKDASSTTKPKVITNENLPKNPDADAGPRESAGKMQAAPPKAAWNGQPAGNQSAEEWKRQILAQKSAIAALQAQIDKVNDSIYFVVANDYYNGVQHNEHQVKKQEDVARMQQQLEEQKKNLAAMQEAARQAGMGNAVYEP